METKDKNFDAFDDFFAFIAEAGEALLAILEDPWLREDKGDKKSFLAFLLRQKGNMLTVAASAKGLSVEDYRATCTPSSLTDDAGAVLKHPAVRDFFGLRREDALSSLPADPTFSAEA